jgi:GDP-L-fucose synthase
MTRAFPFQRVVVTGGAGFLGSYVVEQLAARACPEIIIPRSADYNLVEMEAVRRLFEDTHPDLVIHLAAAVGGIAANQRNPGRYFHDNLMMGVQLMEEARRRRVQKFVAIGTICSYPKFTPVPFKEDDLWNGYPEETNAPYGLAKKMLLVQAQAYRRQYGFNAIFLLPVNLYGPRDNFNAESSHVIPALIHRCIEARRAGAREVVCWGTGNVTREFLHASDCAEGILLATERYDSPEPVNLGAGFEISVRELASMIAHLTGFEGPIVWDTSKPDGQPRRSVNTRRALDGFGFRARVGFEEGLKKTIEWYEQSHFG